MAHPESETAAPTAIGNGGNIESPEPQIYKTGSASATSEILLDLIQTDPDLQMREAGIDVGVVADYAEAMLDGAIFPAIVVYYDGTAYWPADGFHRIAAARKVGRICIGADVRQGNKRDAVLLAVGVNSNHGLRRTQADKRRSVVTLLKDPEWSRLSDRAIAEKANVSHPTVARVRAELTGKISTQPTAVSSPSAGKISTADEKAASGSMVERLLARASDAALIAECQRRGLEVSHAD